MTDPGEPTTLPNDVLPAHLQAGDVDPSNWFCEEHPYLNWPHDDCAGPGITPSWALVLCARSTRLSLAREAIERLARD